MDMEKLFERLVAKIDANQAKAEADRKADKEEGKAAQVKADADRVQMQEKMEAHRRELKEIMEKIMNANHNEKLACRETTEERLEEKKPTSPDRKPEAAQKAEVPAANATVMPVGEPKKKRRRDGKLAAKRRRQKPKNLTWKNFKSRRNSPSLAEGRTTVQQ
jgi:hypothetical protein